MKDSPGAQFRAALEMERPLQIVGTINAYSALLAKHVGFQAVYLSGAGVSNASLGLPDLGLTTLDEVVLDARRIISACGLPMLVDIDTGWGGAFMIARTIKQMIAAGVAAVHIEDQVSSKRCGHRPGKALVSPVEMVDRLKAAVDARSDPDFVIMARTDSISVEGIEGAIDRVAQYRDAGADMIFLEGVSQLEEYRRCADLLDVPILANLTEFGVTPLFTTAELDKAGVRLVLYPLSAFRAMSAAALRVYETVRMNGTQRAVIEIMQTRNGLYSILNYPAYEEKLDQLFAQERTEEHGQE